MPSYTEDQIKAEVVELLAKIAERKRRFRYARRKLQPGIPDKKPISAIDDFLKKAAKIKTKWESGTIDWDP